MPTQRVFLAPPQPEKLSAARRLAEGCLPNRCPPSFVVGRRNWTFAGSDAGGHRAASLYTLIETAKLKDVDPRARLADVLERLPTHAAKRLDDFLPWNWKPQRNLAEAA